MPQNGVEELQSVFIQLEHEARHAESIEALNFIMCNSTRKLFSYHQAVLWCKSITNRVRVETVSGIGLVNRDSPNILWLQRVFTLIARSKKNKILHQVNSKALPVKLRNEWEEWTPPYVLWCPLIGPNERLLGGLWLSRDTPWQEGELTILQELLDAFSHSFNALLVKNKPDWWLKFQKYKSQKNIRIAVAAILVILLFPVRQTVLAPASIVPKEPNVISSPLDGVIEKVLVDPNQEVKKNQSLFVLDDTQFINQVMVAQKALQVSKEKYRKAGQDAFKSDESKGQIAILAAELEKTRAQLDYTKDVLNQITIKSPDDGVVVFGSKHEWVGKPIVIGEKVMLVANPEQKEIDVWLPVSDTIHLPKNAKVKLYLNAAPLSSLTGRVEYMSYSATQRPDGTFAHLVKARFDAGQDVQRIGLKGTAKLYGNRVVLVYYLFWRPISAVRQFVGL